MCRICDEEKRNGYDPDRYKDDSLFESVAYLTFMSPLLVYAFVVDVVFSASRRKARKERTKITRKQKRVYKEWSGR